MTIKAKAVSSPGGPLLVSRLSAGVSETLPWTTADRLQRIETLGQRIQGYVEFMCHQLDHLNGTSAEAKDKAVTIFYERLLMMEQELGRIQENLRLG